jgi:hypothetical protein
MAKISVTAVLTGVHQISQEVGAPEGMEHMIATVEGYFIYKGDKVSATWAVKQVTGSNFNSPDNIEVSKPSGYVGPMD